MNVKGFFSYGEHRSTSLLFILQATFAFQEILKICALILEKKKESFEFSLAQSHRHQ